MPRAPITPATQPIPYEFHKHPGRRWPLLLAYGLAALVIAIGIVFSGRWAYREVKNDKPTAQTAPAGSNKLLSPSASTHKAPAASASAPPPSSTSPSNQSQAAQTLPKTGDDYPGQ